MHWVVLGSAYAILWFLALQILLPIGFKTRQGDPPAALDKVDAEPPHAANIGLKMLLASIGAGVIWAIFYALVLMKVVDV
jgi:predicted secreted protein